VLWGLTLGIVSDLTHAERIEAAGGRSPTVPVRRLSSLYEPKIKKHLPPHSRSLKVELLSRTSWTFIEPHESLGGLSLTVVPRGGRFLMNEVPLDWE